MTKQDILDYFSLIDFAYNESGKLESLSRMLDELLKEKDAVVRCKDCKLYLGNGLCNRSGIHLEVNDEWFCSDGEKATLTQRW